MQGFDILDKHQSILGNFLIEASAGTGKTFTIEHTVLRLLQEEKIPLHRILLLTFTNASQQDLMERVFQRLKKEGFVGFLEEMPILTFQKMLQRFDPQEEIVGKKCPLYIEVYQYFEGLIPYTTFGPKQLLQLLFPQLEDSTTLFAKMEEANVLAPTLSFAESLALVEKELATTCFEEISALFPNLKGLTTTDHELIQKLFLDPQKGWDQQLVKNKRGIMLLIADSVRAKKTVNFPPVIERIQKLCSEQSDAKALWSRFVQGFFVKRGAPLDTFSAAFDRFLLKLEDPNFVETISQRFQAVIVDEFQDTDPRQWTILEKLFLGKGHIKTFMVVGDPKQSIYRFRNADYTSFFAAKERLEQSYQLTKAYRSSINLTSAINSFFTLTHSPFHPIPYTPVIAGRTEPGLNIPFSLFVFEKEEETQLFAWIVTLCQQKMIEPNKTAVLVQHRYQATALEQFLKSYGIGVKRVDKTPLKERLCFQQLTHLLKLLENRFDPSALASYHFTTTQELVPTVPLETRVKIEKIVEAAQNGIFLPFFEEFVSTPLFPLLMEQPITSIADLEELYEELFYHKDTLEDTTNLEGIELITTFSSKGLEYETVIPLALTTDAKRGELSKEDEEERRRLLYVALTRPQERLIVPFVLGKRSTLWKFFEEAFPTIDFGSLQQNISSLHIEVVRPLVAPEFVIREKVSNVMPTNQEREFFFIPSKPRALSFSSMEFEHTNIEKATISEEELPLGVDSGTFIHKVLEKLFSDGHATIEAAAVEEIIDQMLLFSPFKPYRADILKKVQFVLQTSIDGYTLAKIPPFHRMTESPFSFTKEGVTTTGIFDLLLFLPHKLIIIDYKLTHPRSFSTKQLMEAFHYDAQGRLYLEAIQTLFPAYKDQVEMHFLFLRNEVHYIYVLD